MECEKSLRSKCENVVLQNTLQPHIYVGSTTKCMNSTRTCDCKAVRSSTPGLLNFVGSTTKWKKGLRKGLRILWPNAQNFSMIPLKRCSIPILTLLSNQTWSGFWGIDSKNLMPNAHLSISPKSPTFRFASQLTPVEEKS